MALSNPFAWLKRWGKPSKQRPESQLKGLSAILDLYPESVTKKKSHVVWNRGDFAPVLGLARGQLASEGCIEVMTDGGHAPPTCYLPDVYNGSCQLGSGGCCTTVERFYNATTHHLVAVKKMPMKDRRKLGNIIHNEADILSTALSLNIPRIVKPIGTARGPGGMDCLLLELVQGKPLSKHIPSTAQSTPVMERQMLPIAAQLVETLCLLHTSSNICHLDISPMNIMLDSLNSSSWDDVTATVIDFGFAQEFDAGLEVNEVDLSIKDVKPPGCTPPYAAPEVLVSLQMYLESADDHPHLLHVNGSAADMWSLGCVLYELLTGTKPFLPKQHQVAADTVPSCVPPEFRELWRVHQAFHEVHMEWIYAVKRAAPLEDPFDINHPVIHRLRQCSADPDLAVEFFTMLLHPCAHERSSVEALMHPYLADPMQQLADRQYTGKDLCDELESDFSDTESESSSDSEDSPSTSETYASADSHPSQTAAALPAAPIRTSHHAPSIDSASSAESDISTRNSPSSLQKSLDVHANNDADDKHSVGHGVTASSTQPPLSAKHTIVTEVTDWCSHMADAVCKTSLGLKTRCMAIKRFLTW